MKRRKETFVIALQTPVGAVTKVNPDFPLENNYVQVLHHGGPDALAHKPQNQARFFLGTDNSK